MENKALEHSLDLALAIEDQKSVYATQNGYGYHVVNPDMQSRQNINNSDCKYNFSFKATNITNKMEGRW